MKGFFAKYYKRILVAVGVAMLMGMCVSNCSKGNRIRSMEARYASSDSAISGYEDTVRVLRDDIKAKDAEIRMCESKCVMYERQVSDLNKALSRKVVVNVKANEE